MRRIASLARMLTGTLALAASVTVLPATAAFAHADLASSDPADGSSLTAPPASVTLTFNEPLLEETVDVAIQGPDGLVAADAAQADGATVLIPWPAAATGGDFSVNYRVVSADGHPVEGNVRFTIDVAAAAASTAASTAATETSATPLPISSDAPAQPDEVNWVMVIVIMAFGVAAFAALLVATRTVRAKRRP